MTDIVQGYVESRFERLREHYARTLRDDEELGGSLAVMIGGELVVDLWGGFTDAERTAQWQGDTLVCTMSVTKAMAALCAVMQIEKGALELEAPVCRYWPEFAQAGKAAVTVKQVLGHMAALPVADQAPVGAALQWEPLIRGLEIQAPIWEPGTKGTYHSMTYGHLVGELVRRTSGIDLSNYIANHVARPVGAEFVLGCGDSLLARVAPNLPNPRNALMARAHQPPNMDVYARELRLLGDNPLETLYSRDFVKSSFASGAGVTNARSLARIFGALAQGGSLGPARLLTAASLRQAAAEQWNHIDPVQGNWMRASLGFLLPDSFNRFPDRPGVFGTAGGGGYIAFADPERRLSFAYTPGRATSGEGAGDQPAALTQLLYELL